HLPRPPSRPASLPAAPAAATDHLAAAMAHLPDHAGGGLDQAARRSCWRQLTFLYHHYETQPIPNPLSRTLHFMPRWFHRFGVLFNHLTELVAPWFVFGPRHARLAAGVVMVTFQLFLICS